MLTVITFYQDTYYEESIDIRLYITNLINIPALAVLSPSEFNNYGDTVRFYHSLN